MLKKYILAAAVLTTAAAAQALTLDVKSCVEMAVEASENLKSADNSVEQARLQKEVAHTAYLPNLSGNGVLAWSLPDSKYEDMGMTLQMRGVYMAGLSITQPIYAGGRIVAANKMASIGKTAAAEQRRLTYDKLKADAETSYWTYVAVLEKVEMMKSYKALVDTAYARTKTAVDAGMAKRNDLLRVGARRSQVEYQLGQVESGADLCRMSLCALLNIDDATPITPADESVPVEIPAGLGDYNLNDRPEMQLLDADIRIKEEQVKITRADYLPTFGASAGWTAYGNMKIKGMTQAPDGSYVPMSQNIHDNGFNIMLSLQVPIFHWGEGVKKVRAAKIDVENARLSLDYNRRMLNLEVQQTISNVVTGEGLLRSAEVAMKQAQASLDETTQSYRLGMCTLTDMLDAQSQWHTSRSNLIEAQTQLRIYVIDYQRATATI
jgi:outer membrane protein TolC